MRLAPVVRPLVLDRQGLPVMSSERRMQANALSGFLGRSGQYEGAHGGTALKSWNPSAGSADADSLGDLQTLRGRSRDLCRNAPIATAAVQAYARNIVGTGLRPQPRIDADAVGLSPDEAKAWQRQVKKLWQQYAGTTACDVTGRLTFAELTAVVCRAEFESGDCFTFRRAKPRRSDPFWTRLQVIEADRVCNPYYQPDTDTLRGGIETDLDGEPVAYHVTNRHPGEAFFAGAAEWVALPASGPESGDPMMLQNWLPTRPGQSRGVPRIAPVIVALKQLTRYTEAEIMAAVVASMFTVFISSPATEPETGGLGNLPADGENAGASTSQPSSEYRMGNGSMIDLDPGEEATFADPTRPNPNFDPFTEALLRQIGAALEIPYELLVMQFMSSYSAARGALLEAWRAVFTHRGRLVNQFCQPVYCWFVTEMVARGFIDAPGFMDDPFIKAAWLGCSWSGDAMGQIDPLKEITAAKERVALTVSTLEDETNELTGEDWNDTVEQRGREEAKLKELGLVSAPAAPVNPNPSTDPSNSNPDEPPPPADENQQQGGAGYRGRRTRELANV